MKSTQSDAAEAQTELERRMARLGIRECDLKESFVRSAGSGGQNVNKVATCVQLLHEPSGIQVKCQTSRHQGQNRKRALELLVGKFEQLEAERKAAETARVEKARRQNRKRSRGAKERMLANKALRSEKKRSRRAVERD